MSSIEKLIRKLAAAKGFVAYAYIERVMHYHGYQKTKVAGSHFHFEKLDAPPITFPVHNGKVKIWYVRPILKIIIKEKHEES